MNCLLIICPGCQNVMTKCTFVYHCENECVHKEINCLNQGMGCPEVLSQSSMKDHLKRRCVFKLNELCSCTGIANNIPSAEIVSTSCLDHCRWCISGTCENKNCAMILCVCGVRMHRCKLDEHIEFVCLETVVPCINNWCGCEVKLRRGDRGVHLVKCAASVVSCGAEWSREARGLRVFRRWMDRGCRWGSGLKKRLIEEATLTVTDTFSAGLALHDQLNILVSLDDNLCLIESRSLMLHESFSLLGRPTTRLNGSFLEMALLNREGPNTDDEEVDLVDDEDDLVDEEEEMALYSDLQEARGEGVWQVRSTHPSMQRAPGAFTFYCGQTVPRSEFSAHCQQHSDLRCQMDGWVEAACPHAARGCPFRVMRLCPAGGGRLLYLPLANLFGVRFHDDGVEEGGGCDHSICPSEDGLLLRLPLEVLLRVCALLDGCSLQRLAGAHPLLARAVAAMVGSACVSLRWRRAGRAWRGVPVPFLPASRGSAAPLRLQLARDHAAALAHHLLACSHAGPLALGPLTAPFCLHALSQGAPLDLLPEFLQSTARPR